jgi:hypothetical protein
MSLPGVAMQPLGQAQQAQAQAQAQQAQVQKAKPQPYWFHRGPFLLGLAIMLALGAIVFFLWYSVTHKNLLAGWSGP